MSASEDFRWQKQSLPGQTSINVGTVDSAFVPQNLGRVGLIIEAPLTNRVTLSWSGAAVLDQGITLYPGGPPLVLSLLLHGALVQGAIRAITTAAAQNVVYAESSYSGS